MSRTIPVSNISAMLRLRITAAGTSLCKCIKGLLEQLLLGLARPVDGKLLDAGKRLFLAPKVVEAEVVRAYDLVVHHVQHPVDNVVAMCCKHQVYMACQCDADHFVDNSQLPDGFYVRFWLLDYESAARPYAVHGDNYGNVDTMPDPAEPISIPQPDGSVYRAAGSPPTGDASSDPPKSLDNVALAAPSRPPEIVSSTVL